MITRRERHDATAFFVIIQRLDFVGRTANLERTRALQVLAFEEHLLAGHFIEKSRRNNRCAVNARRDSLACRMDQVSCKHESISTRIANTSEKWATMRS